MSKVSIIMPAFNVEKYIARSIESVVMQTYPDWELIVIDDGSTDATASIVADLKGKENRIKYYYQENKKLPAARNTGIAHATGEWIAFLDADDLWEPNKLSVQFKYIKEVVADVYFSGGYSMDENDKTIAEYKTIYGSFTGIEIYKLLFFQNPIPVLSVIMKRSWVMKVGPQDETLICEDWDYWLRLGYSGAKFYGIDEKLFRYRINPQGISSKVLQMRIGECSALYKNLDYSLFTNEEIEKIRQRFDTLIKYIIDSLFSSHNTQLVPYYLNLLAEIKGGSKYKYAELIFNLLGAKSRRPVNFILYH
jgi:teichuronic acid biosynthesis glycosyltransferase TuaG